MIYVFVTTQSIHVDDVFKVAGLSEAATEGIVIVNLVRLGDEEPTPQ